MSIEAEKIKRREVTRRELEWHEQEAHRRYSLDEFLYDPPAFDGVVGAMIGYLRTGRTLHGDRMALDVGSGEGKETLALALAGFSVIGTDLSMVQLLRTRERIANIDPNLPVQFVQTNVEELPFADGSIKAVHGKAILHHLDLKLSGVEFGRILKNNGRATFAEPLAHHPLFWLGRRSTPKLRTEDERPMAYAELADFGNAFAKTSMGQAFLLAPLAYGLRILPMGEKPFRVAHAILQIVDKVLFTLLPPLRKIAWYAWVNVEK